LVLLDKTFFNLNKINRKVKSFKQCFYRNSVRCQKLEQVFEEQSFGLDTGPQLFFHLFIVLSITRCSNSAHKFAVMVRQVTTVVVVRKACTRRHNYSH